MEDPKSVRRLVLATVGVGTVAALGFSIYYWNFYYLLGWLAILILFPVICRVLALFNLTMFSPILWLAGKLSDRRERKLRLPEPPKSGPT